MEVQSVVSELSSIIKEEKNIRKNLAKLRARRKELETQVIEYLKTNDDPGLVFKGTAFSAQDLERRSRLSKIEKRENLVEILREEGIGDIDSVLAKIMSSMSGDPELVTKLVVKNLK